MIDMQKYQSKIDSLQQIFEKKSKPLDSKDLTIIKCALGANEEAGELAHVVLKSITGTYGFDDKEKVREKVVDSVIDMFVFGIQILNEYNVNFEEAFPKVLEDVVDRNENNRKHIPIQK